MTRFVTWTKHLSPKVRLVGKEHGSVRVSQFRTKRRSFFGSSTRSAPSATFGQNFVAPQISQPVQGNFSGIQTSEALPLYQGGFENNAMNSISPMPLTQFIQDSDWTNHRQNSDASHNVVGNFNAMAGDSRSSFVSHRRSRVRRMAL